MKEVLFAVDQQGGSDISTANGKRLSIGPYGDGLDPGDRVVMNDGRKLEIIECGSRIHTSNTRLGVHVEYPGRGFGNYCLFTAKDVTKKKENTR